MKIKKSTGYWLISVGSVSTTAVLGWLFTSKSIINWYPTIFKPIFTPPNWLFGPAWTILYGMMIFALNIVLNSSPTKQRQKVINLFYLQLFFNALWSLVFFRFHLIGTGLIIMAILWILIYLNMTNTNKFSITAGWLLIPYLLWVSLALVLNYSIWILN